MFVFTKILSRSKPFKRPPAAQFSSSLGVSLSVYLSKDLVWLLVCKYQIQHFKIIFNASSNICRSALPLHIPNLPLNSRFSNQCSFPSSTLQHRFCFEGQQSLLCQQGGSLTNTTEPPNSWETDPGERGWLLLGKPWAKSSSATLTAQEIESGDMRWFQQGAGGLQSNQR